MSKASFVAKDSRISGNPKATCLKQENLTLSFDAKSYCFDEVLSVKELERKEKVNKKVEKFYTQEKIYHWNK